MHISLEKPTSLERRLTVELPEERIAPQVQTKLEELRRQVRIDGFRHGKAPLTVVRQRFGRRVRDEVVGELLQSSFAEALSKESLRPAGQPVIGPVSSEPGSGLQYTASFEVFPEITLADPEGLQIERVVCAITDEDIDAMIEKLREQSREWLAVDRAAQDGDRVEIDFSGTVDDEAFEGGNGEAFALELGTGSMIDGFEEGIRGMAAGDERVLELQFPDEYRNEQLAGKPVRFEIAVKKVSEGALPEINAEFMERFGVKDGELEAFRAEVRRNMEKERERVVRQRFNREVMAKLAAANRFDVPESLVGAEMNTLRQQLQQELLMRGMDPRQMGEQFGQMVRARAVERVKLGLLMAEVIKRAELKPDPAKVRNMLEEMAASYEDPSAVVQWHYDNPEQLRQIESLCLEDETVNWLADRAQVTEVTTSFDGLMNPVQTGAAEEAST